MMRLSVRMVHVVDLDQNAHSGRGAVISWSTLFGFKDCLNNYYQYGTGH